MIKPELIINTYASLMYQLKKFGNLEKRIYRAAVSQSLRNTTQNNIKKKKPRTVIYSYNKQLISEF